MNVQKSRVGLLATLILVMACTACGGGNGDDIGVDESGHETGQPAQFQLSLRLEAAYSEAFSFLNGVRELSNGRILVADPLGQVVLSIDLDAGTADTLGSVGPGPQEYEQPDQVMPLVGDSTLLVDFGKTYLTVIGPDGSFVGGRSMMVPRENGFPGIIHPRFGDSEGNLYYQPSRSYEGGHVDSARVARFDLQSQTGETAATIWAPEVEQIQIPGQGFLPRLMGPLDDWAVGPDGRVAVIRAQDYSLTWFHPDGNVIVGPSHALEPLPLDRETKEAHIPLMRASGISMTSSTSRNGEGFRMGMSRGLSNDGPGVDDFQWAETVPLFRPERTRVSPRGEAWVERWLPPDSTARFDVFDEDGTLIGSVPLPPGRQLLGFGRGQGGGGTADTGGEVAYLVRTDEYDLRWLERYQVVRGAPG